MTVAAVLVGAEAKALRSSLAAVLRDSATLALLLLLALFPLLLRLWLLR
jgi:hypothetical protein